jgi:CRISPR-associated protein Csx14
MADSVETTFVTTMGGQAQVVTFALDWLLGQGETVRDVVVIHLSPENPRVSKALSQLAVEFSGDQYAGRPCRFRHVAIHANGAALTDLRDEADAEATWQTVYGLVAKLKAERCTLHVCIAGGRRLMGLLAMSAAMLHFGHRDRLWHLFTPDELRQRAFEGAIMHAEEADGVRLIQVPMAPWGAYFPGLKELVGAPASRVMAAQAQWLESKDHARCGRVVERLTERQRAVLQLVAAGRTPQEVADALSVTLKTVDAHKSVILAECRNEWTAPPGGRLDYHFLRDKFSRHFTE